MWPDLWGDRRWWPGPPGHYNTTLLATYKPINYTLLNCITLLHYRPPNGHYTTTLQAIYRPLHYYTTGHLHCRVLQATTLQHYRPPSGHYNNTLLATYIPIHY